MTVTAHATEKGKERLRLNSSALERTAEKALEHGITHSQSKGRLNKYITSLYFRYQTANNIRVYGENVFIFKESVLITVYQLPNNLKKYAKLKP